jgi:LCP family protein required for cell wall assembly
MAGKRPKWKKVVGWVTWSVFTLVCGLAGTLMGWAGQSTVLMDVIRDTVPILPSQPKAITSDEMTLLVLGCDVNYDLDGTPIKGSYGRSDSILVARLDFKNKQVTGVSIPRDTLVSTSRYGTQKINAFHVIGGASLTESVVESLLDVEIDRTIVLNFFAFEEMVDMLGGVEVNVPKRMQYVDNAANLHIDLEPGRQTLKGDDALDFMRYRLDSDFKRQERQKSLMLALKGRMLEKWQLIPQATDKTLEIMDHAFTPKELAELLAFSRKVDSGKINLGMVPVVEKENFALYIDTSKLEEVLREHGLRASADLSGDRAA